MKTPFHRTARILALILLVSLTLSCGKFQAKKLGIEEPKYRVKVEKNVMVEMRDGVKMATDIYYPAGLAKAPAILVRTPYSKGTSAILGKDDTAKLFAERGYVFIVQDVRGRFKSEGEFYPFVNDGQDGQDMIAWIQDQDWYNGRLGTYGASYLGTTQWFASPGQDISAMHLTVTSPDLKEVLYTNGELHLMTVFFWAMMMGEHEFDLAMAPKLANLENYMAHLPLGQADDNMGRDVEYFNQALDPVKIWKIYDEVNFDTKYKEVKAPAVFIAGWYDMFLGPQLKDFQRLLEDGQGNARRSILIVGPWGHGASGKAVDYGEEADREKAMGPKHLLAWFDYWLKDKDSGVDEWPRVRIFVMGDNVWRDENEWPLERTEYTSYYIHSNGSANTRSGDGTLSLDPPDAEPPDKFDYDPLNPAPTLGGNNLGLNLGAYDQAKVEDRKDVLCYTSEVLKQDLEVTGPISAKIYAATDAVDTDFSVKLIDLYPDGKAVNIQDGIVRAMYRNNDPDNPTPLTPGAIEEYTIDLWATSNVFKAGHRIRLEISSSNFPRFNRNLNTGEPVGEATRTMVAHQVIYHDAEHPSKIILPIIPKTKDVSLLGRAFPTGERIFWPVLFDQRARMN